jgi:hypothetical protein
MKINGKKIEGANLVTVVIPRGDNEKHVFKAQAVLKMDEFDAIMKPPVPPIITKPGGEKFNDTTDVNYQKNLDLYASGRTNFLILKSLEATEGLEWETIDMKDPTTWDRYFTELTDAGFSDREISIIINGVMEANALNEGKIKEARDSFLAEQRQALLSKSPTVAQ